MEQKPTRDTEFQQIFQAKDKGWRNNEENYHLFAEALPEIAWMSTANGEIAYYNQRWYDFTGHTRETQIKSDWWSHILHPDDCQRYMDIRTQALQNGTPGELEHRFWDCLNKEYRWFLTRTLPVFDQTGTLSQWFGTCTDIHERKQAKEKLLFHASLAQNISDAVISTNLDEQITTWNSAAETLYGWTVSEALGTISDEILHTQYLNITREEWLKHMLTCGSWHGEMRQQKHDGSWMDIQAGISRIVDIEGKIVGHVGIYRDITLSKVIAQELSEREQQLQLAIDIAKLGVWKFIPSTREVICSPQAKINLGFAVDAPITEHLLIEHLFANQANGPHTSQLQNLDKQVIYEQEYQVRWPDSSIHWLAVRGQGQYDEDGKLLVVSGVTLDITEQKVREERKNIFIGMASHELKTPLTTVKGFTQLLKRQLKKLGLGEQTTTLINMEEQINSLNRLVNELMDVTRIQAGQMDYTWAEVNIDELIKHVVVTHRHTSTHHKLRIKGQTRQLITGDRSHLEQVFSNLISNAIKYSPQADHIDIGLGSTKESVFVKIRDYGVGIPATEIAHIFEHFYRANTARKQAIQGLGMGLYIAQEIIAQHGGKITVESDEGKGSTFCVKLPFSFQPENPISSGVKSDDAPTSDR